MNYAEWFDTNENKALLAICARKLIKNIGIGGIIWGVINGLLGLFFMQFTLINTGLLILGVLMLGAGVRALKKPTLSVLLVETVLASLILLWNLSITIINAVMFGITRPGGLIFPAIMAIYFFNHYRRLKHVAEYIESIDPAYIETTTQLGKKLLKKNLKQEPLVIQTTDRRCRAELMNGKAFFIQKNMLRAFVCPIDQIRAAIVKPDAKSLKIVFSHPLEEKLTYRFDKKNSEKIRNWLASVQAEVNVPVEVQAS